MTGVFGLFIRAWLDFLDLDLGRGGAVFKFEWSLSECVSPLHAYPTGFVES